MTGRFLARLFASRWQQRLSQEGVAVFVYHYLGTAPQNTADRFLYVTPEHFERQLRDLRAAGFTSGSLDETAAQPVGAAQKCVITFDDGAANVLENAPAALARHQFPSIQFIVAGLIGKRNEWDARNGRAAVPLMDAAQIREWLAAGHEIGSHSFSHPNLTRLDPAEAREQITASKKLLEDTFGREVRHFCYPHGRSNPQVRELVEEAGYQTACTTAFGVRTPQTPRCAVPRIFPLSAAEWIGKIADRLLKKLR